MVIFSSAEHHRLTNHRIDCWMLYQQYKLILSPTAYKKASTITQKKHLSRDFNLFFRRTNNLFKRAAKATNEICRKLLRRPSKRHSQQPSLSGLPSPKRSHLKISKIGPGGYICWTCLLDGLISGKTYNGGGGGRGGACFGSKFTFKNLCTYI